jgi:hypothetical protein
LIVASSVSRLGQAKAQGVTAAGSPVWTEFELTIDQSVSAGNVVAVLLAKDLPARAQV